MNNMRALVEQYLRAAWRRRWLGVGIAWLGCLLGWAGVYTIPNQFQSSARVFVDADAILTPLLQGIAANSAPQTQLELIERTLLSRPNLDKLISKTDLDLSVHGPADRERLIDRLQRQIQVSPQTANLFTITYRDPDPRMAYNIVQTLLTIFVESATGTNRSDMDNARRFLQNQIASYEEQLRAAEQRRAAFRARFAEVLPESGSKGSALDAIQGRLGSLEGQIEDAVTTQKLLRKELNATPPMLVESAILQQQANSQIQQAEERLRMLLLKDTPQHPDVVAQEKLIAELKREAAGDASKAAAAAQKREMQARKSTDGGTTKPMPLPPNTTSVPNPVYDHLKVKLVDTDMQVLMLRRQYQYAMQNLHSLKKILHEQPGLLAQYDNMDRDYGVLRQTYDALLTRLQMADIAQAADTQADKVKILVVDPPQISHVPVAPNRILMVSAVLLLAIAAGVGAPILLGQFDNSFSSSEDLRRIGLPVLGGVSVLGIAPLRQRLLVVARLGFVLAILAMLYGGLMLHLIRTGAPI